MSLLVVDASVARASGDGPNPPARECRETLDAILRICHRAAMPQALFREWREHRSGHAHRWLKLMFGPRKVDRLALATTEELRAKLRRIARTPRERTAMEKDAHLLATAIEHGAGIVSLDDEARGLFHRAAAQCAVLRRIVWVNPAHRDEAVIAWLEAGAPDEPARRLGRDS